MIEERAGRKTSGHKSVLGGAHAAAAADNESRMWRSYANLMLKTSGHHLGAASAGAQGRHQAGPAGGCWWRRLGCAHCAAVVVCAICVRAAASTRERSRRNEAARPAGSPIGWVDLVLGPREGSGRCGRGAMMLAGRGRRLKSSSGGEAAGRPTNRPASISTPRHGRKT
jgi:hypothetical protein